MVNYTLNLGSKAAVHCQLQTLPGYRDRCSLSITNLIWAHRLLFMVSYKLYLVTEAAVHCQLQS